MTHINNMWTDFFQTVLHFIPPIYQNYQLFPQGRGYAIVINTAAWLDCLGSGISFEKYDLGFFKKIDLNDS